MSNPYELQSTSVRRSKEEAYAECAQEMARMRKTVKEGRGTYEEVFWDFYTAANLLWLLTRGNLRGKMEAGAFADLEEQAERFFAGMTPTDSHKRAKALRVSVEDGLEFADKLMSVIDQKGVVI